MCRNVFHVFLDNNHLPLVKNPCWMRMFCQLLRGRLNTALSPHVAWCNIQIDATVNSVRQPEGEGGKQEVAPLKLHSAG